MKNFSKVNQSTARYNNKNDYRTATKSSRKSGLTVTFHQCPEQCYSGPVNATIYKINILINLKVEPTRFGTTESLLETINWH